MTAGQWEETLPAWARVYHAQASVEVHRFAIHHAMTTSHTIAHSISQPLEGAGSFVPSTTILPSYQS